MTPQEFILGPQVPVSNSWFDQTHLSRARAIADNFPATPPGTYDDPYIMTHYYDLGRNLYMLYARTGDPADLARARKIEDSWWANSWWIGSGTVRRWPEEASPPPRHAGIGGLILRALDGRPEMWDWITEYTKFHLDLWLKRRISDSKLYYGVREGAFALQDATWLALAHPDVAVRSQFLADVENIVINYFARLQYPDGSWRWDDPDEIVDGGLLIGIMQPFMVGLLLHALVDVHRLSTNVAVKASALDQITKACRHLYSDGPYLTQFVPSLGVRLRGFAYYYHGGTTVDPTKYESGNYPANWDTTDPSNVQNARQGISTIVAAFGYVYLMTGDSFFKSAGDELWDSAYGETDGIRNYMAGDGKSLNQNCRSAPSYRAWIGGTIGEPAPLPTPSPNPTPTPPQPESASNTRIPPATQIVDSAGTVWTRATDGAILRNGTPTGGAGPQLLYCNHIVYAFGMDSQWWKWSGGWARVGATDPCATPDPTPVPIPVPPTPALTRVLRYPTALGDQATLWQVQAKDGYRPSRIVPRPANQPKGNYVEFVKFP
jgi:hypothetical protein